MTKKHKPPLTEEDLEIWQAYQKGVIALPNKIQKKPKSSKSSSKTQKMKSSPISAKAIVKTRDPIRKKIDLHGYKVEEARTVLMNFLMRKQQSHQLQVIVITGKGLRGSISGLGTLKENFSKWMKEKDFLALVNHYSQASPKDGGSGAFYLDLKPLLMK